MKEIQKYGFFYYRIYREVLTFCYNKAFHEEALREFLIVITCLKKYEYKEEINF